jgi:hypothetical protein
MAGIVDHPEGRAGIGRRKGVVRGLAARAIDNIIAK